MEQRPTEGDLFLLSELGTVNEDEYAYDEEEEKEPEGPRSYDFMFKSFATFGDVKSNGDVIALSQSDNWMRQAKILDGRKITTTDTGVLFYKFKRRAISMDDYMKFLESLAKRKNLDLQTDIMDKLLTCGLPGSDVPAAPVDKKPSVIPGASRLNVNPSMIQAASKHNVNPEPSS